MDRGGFERELSVAESAARAAGERILHYARVAGPDGPANEQKAPDSPVTRADVEANELICDALRQAFPDDAILSEETRDSAARHRARRVWIVDPLDGTKEFIARIPEYAVSIALVTEGEPTVGVVFQPQTDECFTASRGAGAWLGPERLQISARTELRDSALLSSRTEMSRGQIDPFRDWFAEVRPIGSVALKLALVAAARGDLWVSMAPKSEWDVCAGDLLVREAGGVFLGTTGPRRYNQEDVLLQPELAAGPAKLVDAFRSRREVLP